MNKYSAVHFVNISSHVLICSYLICALVVPGPLYAGTVDHSALAPKSSFEHVEKGIIRSDDDLTTPVFAFGPLNKGGTKLGAKIGEGLIYPGYASPQDIVEGLTLNNIKVDENVGGTIGKLQRYFRSVVKRSPVLTKDHVQFNIEFRRRVAKYSYLRGNTVVLDVALLKVPSDDLLPLLAYILGHEGTHALEAVRSQKHAEKLDMKRFAGMSARNQVAVWNALTQLKAKAKYITKLEQYMRPGSKYIVGFTKKIGLKDSLSGNRLRGKLVHDWAKKHLLLLDHPHRPNEPLCRLDHELRHYNSIMERLLSERTPVSEVIEFIEEYARGANDRQMRRYLHNFLRAAGPRVKNQRTLLIGPLEKRSRSRGKRKALKRMLRKGSPLHSAAEGFFFKDAVMMREGKLFNEIDIMGLNLMDIPLWPVDEKGIIREDLIDWMLTETGSPTREYFFAKKVSLNDVLNSFADKTPQDTSREGIQLSLFDLPGVDSPKKVKTEYLGVPMEEPSPANFKERLDGFVEKLENNDIDDVAVVGDIHGNILRLNQILDAIDDRKINRVVFTGDYMNRDIGGIKVMEEIQKRVKSGTAVALMGNHEPPFIAMMLGNDEKSVQSYEYWMFTGGWAVLEEIGIAEKLKDMGIDLKIAEQIKDSRNLGPGHPLTNYLDTMAKKHRDVILPMIRENKVLRDLALWMLKNLRMYHIDENNTFYVHAGVSMYKDGSIAYDYKDKKGFDVIELYNEWLGEIREKLNDINDLNYSDDKDEIVRFVSDDDFQINPLLRDHWPFGGLYQETGGINEDGLENLLCQLGALRIISAHTPQSSQDLTKVAREYSGRIIVNDFGISYSEPASVEGGFVTIGNDGVMISLYRDSKISDTEEIQIIDRDELLYQAKVLQLKLADKIRMDYMGARGNAFSLESIKGDKVINFVETPEKPIEEVRDEVKAFGENLVSVNRAKQHTINVEGREFTVIIERDTELTDSMVGALIEKAVERTKNAGGDIKAIPSTLVFAILDSSSHMFEDHLQNGFIGINRSLYSINDAVVRQIILKIGIFHELCHEATVQSGKVFEAAQLIRDARYAFELVREAFISKGRFGRVLKGFFGISIKPFINEINRIAPPLKTPLQISSVTERADTPTRAVETESVEAIEVPEKELPYETREPFVKEFDHEAVGIALEINPEAFDESGKGRIFFDRVGNKIFVDGKPQEWGVRGEKEPWLRNAAEFKLEYQRKNPAKKVLAVLPNGNLGHNDWFTGVNDEGIYHYQRDDLSREREILVQKRDGTITTLTVRFINDAGERGVFDVREPKEDISKQIICGVYGQRIVKDGKDNILSVYDHFDDLRHLFRFPLFQVGKDQYHLGFSDGEGEMYFSRDKVKQALEGKPVELSLEPLRRKGISDAEREEEFAIWGYTNVTGVKDTDDLRPGEYVINKDDYTMTVSLLGGVHPHSLFGLTRGGRVLVGAVTGRTHHRGSRIQELIEDLIEQGAKDVFLWANGKDTVVDLGAAGTIKAEGARGEGISALMVVWDIEKAKDDISEIDRDKLEGLIRSDDKEKLLAEIRKSIDVIKGRYSENKKIRAYFRMQAAKIGLFGYELKKRSKAVNRVQNARFLKDMILRAIRSADDGRVMDVLLDVLARKIPSNGIEGVMGAINSLLTDPENMESYLLPLFAKSDVVPKGLGFRSGIVKAVEDKNSEVESDELNIFGSGFKGSARDSVNQLIVACAALKPIEKKTGLIFDTSVLTGDNVEYHLKVLRQAANSGVEIIMAMDFDNKYEGDVVKELLEVKGSSIVWASRENLAANVEDSVKGKKWESYSLVVSDEYLEDYAQWLDLGSLAALLVSDRAGNLKNADLKMIEMLGLTDVAKQLKEGNIELLDVLDMGVPSFNEVDGSLRLLGFQA
ncbi:metallophosphoesterase [Candidatus Auribacterota bacterium]